MVAVSTMGHRFIAQMCSRFLREKHIVVLHSGRTGGALEFLHILKENGLKRLPLIAEAQDFLYSSRTLGPAHVRIFSIRNSVPLATLPNTENQRVLKVINKVYPQFIPGENILKTSFNNVEAFLHPALAILNASRIEDTHGDFKYYIQGASKSVAKVLEKIDKERLEVAAALGMKAISMRDWLYTAYSANGRDLFEAIHDNPGYLGIRAPDRIHHRYIDEDISMSLVPIASLGAMLKVQTPTINSIIQLASVMKRKDFFSEGRTIDRMGLKGKSAKEIRSIVLKGKEK